MSNQERIDTLALWLEERRLTYQSLAEAMGVSRPFVSVMLGRETMPDKRWRQCLMLGIPEDLLPRPFMGNMGRPRKIFSIENQKSL